MGTDSVLERLPECGRIPHVGGPGTLIRHAEFFRTPAISRGLGPAEFAIRIGLPPFLVRQLAAVALHRGWCRQGGSVSRLAGLNPAAASCPGQSGSNAPKGHLALQGGLRSLVR